jgi:thiamine-phosphate pyrophosphorylase
MTVPRLFLVAPGLPIEHVLACVKAATTAGDVASIVVTPVQAPALAKPLQNAGIAVIVAEDANAAAANRCDGVQISDAASYAPARQTMGKNGIVGIACGSSRHLAMEMAEAGADYVAFSQSARAPGNEPIIKWWSDVFEAPCVAYEPVEDASLDTLLPQNPDFIRPSDTMWDTPEDARRLIESLSKRLKA